MGFRKTHDIAVKTGTYQKNGETKNQYENVGYVLTGDDGGKMHCINRTFNPAGVPAEGSASSVLLYIFEIRAKHEGQQASAGSTAPADQGPPADGGDIPF